MESFYQKSYENVLTTLIYSESLQFVLKRVKPMSAQLEILIIDRQTQSLRNTISTMQFEGVSKDDLNYHLLVNYEPHFRGKEVNQLLLLYPNGILCIYDNILQQGSSQGRKKVRLQEMIQADYQGIIAPKIIARRLLFVSRSDKTGPILVSIDMDHLKEEIQEARQMSGRHVQVIRIIDQVAHQQINDIYKDKKKKNQEALLAELIKSYNAKLKILDVNYSLINGKDILCFISFTNGQILHYSFQNVYRKNKVFSLADFQETEVFQRVFDASEPQDFCATALDFVSTQDGLGLLIVADQVGFVYLIEMYKEEGVDDKLIFMASLSGQHELCPATAIQWLSWKDLRFMAISAEGDLTLYDLKIKKDELGPDQVTLTKLMQLQQFEALSPGFQFYHINQLGNQSIQFCQQSTMRPAFMTENLSILWPSRILKKHDTEGVKKDKVITQMTLHNFQLTSTVYPLSINQCLGGYQVQQVFVPSDDGQKMQISDGLKTSPVAFCGGLSSNGAMANTIPINEMVPQQIDDQLACPQDNETIFYVDDQSINYFSNVTGKTNVLIKLAKILPDQAAVTTIQVRLSSSGGIIKFLLNWVDPFACSPQMKYQFTQITFDFTQSQILESITKTGLYASFLVGQPSNMLLPQLDNINETIVSLNEDPSCMSVGQTSVLQVHQFDPFADFKEVNLLVKILQLYTTPLRQGKVILFYNVDDNILQFSRNKSDKYQEDDYNIYANRKYAFNLSYDEKVVDVKWVQSTSSKEQDLTLSRSPSKKTTMFESFNASQSIQSLSDLSMGGKQSYKAVIATNHKIYIVDKNLSIIQNYNLVSHQQRLTVRSLQVIAGNTVLFSTSHHLYYLTQEKSAIKPDNVILAFNKADPRVRPQIVGALADRLITVQRIITAENGVLKSEIKFQTLQISMLEPLLLGYLSSIPAKSVGNLDIDLVQRVCKFLDTTQISPNLMNKLKQFGLFNSCLFLYQSAVQFEATQKLEAFCHLNGNDINLDLELQKQFLEYLFPAKDLNTNPEDASQMAIEERNDIILKLQNDQGLALEKQVLSQNLESLKHQKLEGYPLIFALSLCELLSNDHLAMRLLKLSGQQIFQNFNRGLMNSNEHGQYDQMLWLAQNGAGGLSEHVFKVLTFSQQKCINWHDKVWNVIPVKKKISLKKEKQFDQQIMKLNLAFGESSHIYFVRTTAFNQSQEAFKALVATQSDTMGAWLGFDNTQPQDVEILGVEQIQPMKKVHLEQGEAPDEPYNSEDEVKSDQGADDIEEKESVLAYYRFDEGQGDKVADLTDNQIACQLDGEWSSEPLEVQEPIDHEDKWGKQVPPSYSVKLLCLSSEDEKDKLPRSLNNFSVEFWLRSDKNGPINLSILGLNLQIQNNQITLKINEVSENCTYNLTGWTHLAITFSIQKGAILFITGKEMIKIKKEFKPIKLSRNTVEIFKVSDSVEITELRIWKVTLTEKIISENFEQPLPLCHEQKRRLKVNMKKKQGGGGLGAPLGASKFGTAVNKLSGLSKLDKKPFATSFDFVPEKKQEVQAAAAAPSGFDFNFQTQEALMPEDSVENTIVAPPTFPVQELKDPEFDQNFSFRTPEPGDKEEEELPANADERVLDPALADDFATEMLDSEEVAELRVKMNKEYKPLPPKPKKKQIQLKSTIQVESEQDSFASPNTTKDSGKGIFQVKSKMTKHSRQLNQLEQTLTLAQTYENLESSLVSCLSDLITLEPNNNFKASHELLCNTIQDAYKLSERFAMKLSVPQALNFIQIILKQMAGKSIEKQAFLSTLFPEQIHTLTNQILRPGRNVDSGSVHLCRVLCLKLVSFAIRVNLHSHQFDTATRLMDYYNKNLKQYTNGISKALETLQASIENIELDPEDQIDYGFLILEANEDERTPIKCPQCSSKLIYGAAQKQCFECMAMLTVCQQTMVQLYDDPIFVVYCKHCPAVFDRQSILDRRRNNDYSCPGCLQKIDL